MAHLPNLLSERLAEALAGMTEKVDTFSKMVRPTADAAHGDYQINVAMPLAKSLGRKDPTEVAREIVERLKLDDLCESIEVAGPGFINVKLAESFLVSSVCKLVGDPRCGVGKLAHPRKVVIDFSSPNVAKPLHIGHIRSIVIGDSLARLKRFLGDDVITDNHLGDWGTQFGIIIYGYRHFGDDKKIDENPVEAIVAIYRKTQKLIDYHKSIPQIQRLKEQIEKTDELLEIKKTEVPDEADAKAKKKHAKALKSLENKRNSVAKEIESLNKKRQSLEADPVMAPILDDHREVGDAVLKETAKLHEGDPDNIALWKRFLSITKSDMNHIYDRLDIRFDKVLGESFYHPMLQKVVKSFQDSELATVSDGAVCVFLDGFDAPMIIQKQDGAFLYATTDLATLEYRKKEFDPDQILYVVDARQSEHFQKLFAVADRMGLENAQLVHVQFGTVQGPDGKPLKTRDGELVQLEDVLNQAIARAAEVVCKPDRLHRFDPPMDKQEQDQVAKVVGIGAVKFADLSHERTSDYRFDLEKMVALEGNTSAYIQYQYARTQSILRKSDFSADQLSKRLQDHPPHLTQTEERELLLALLRFEESLLIADREFAMNFVSDYLIDTARTYARFNDGPNCSVLKAETEGAKSLRLLLVVLAGDVLRKGLSLLGIETCQRM